MYNFEEGGFNLGYSPITDTFAQHRKFSLWQEIQKGREEFPCTPLLHQVLNLSNLFQPFFF